MAESTEPRSSSEPVAPVRRLPVPTSLPPYDDEADSLSRRPGQAPRTGPAANSATHGALALAVSQKTMPSLDAGVAPPDPRRWVAKLTQAALECLYGQRPVQQLTRWTDEAVYTALTRRIAGRRVRSAVQPRIRAVRVCRVNAVIAEATSITQLGPQTRAVAVRLEADGQRWVCTAFELVERPGAVSR